MTSITFDIPVDARPRIHRYSFRNPSEMPLRLSLAATEPQKRRHLLLKAVAKGFYRLEYCNSGLKILASGLIIGSKAADTCTKKVFFGVFA
jgi:hypothetical protein